jgi:alanine racemase
MVMLKAFGYGSSDAELGRWLQHQGVEWLAVAYTDEGVSLRKSGVTLPIMVLNPEISSFETLVANQLEPEIYSVELLDAFREYAQKTSLNDYPIHLKLDTGMHRLGFLPDESDEISHRLLNQNRLKVVSIFTHLVASENPQHDAFTNQQASLFEAFCNKLEKALGRPFIKHAANSAAISRHPNLHYDMVRLGIGLFGLSKPAQGIISLQPVTFLYTTVAQIKNVKAGQSVGYGRHAFLQKDSSIATVRIGYADGFSRRLGNGVGYMWWKGHRISVVGNVCMDMTMLDVTDLPDLSPGDRIEVFGEHISIHEIAGLCDTIPYEIMTGISQRVKRVLLEE